jgi:hypothetical protein
LNNFCEKCHTKTLKIKTDRAEALPVRGTGLDYLAARVKVTEVSPAGILTALLLVVVLVVLVSLVLSTMLMFICVVGDVCK